MQASTPKIELCTICSKPTHQKCAGCKTAYYCSSVCQSLDYPLHKLLCKQYIPFLATRPAPIPNEHSRIPTTFKLAILLPESSVKPELIWLASKTELFIYPGQKSYDPDNDDNRFENLHEDLVKHIEVSLTKEMLFRNGHDLYAMISDMWIGGEKNLCFETLNQGYGCCDRGDERRMTTFACGGNIVITRHLEAPNRWEDTALYQDITLADLRYGFDYYARRNIIFESSRRNPIYIHEPARWVRGVKSSNRGDIKFIGKKKYREVAIRRDLAMFEKDKSGICSASKYLGFPLICQSMGIDPAWRAWANEGGPNFVNIDGDVLMRC